MDFSESERAIINLKILSKITGKTKLKTDGHFFSLQPHVPFITPLKRAVVGEKRSNTISMIKKLVDTSEMFLNSKDISDETKSEIKFEIENAAEGLLSLINTYSDDMTVQSQLNVIRSKFLRLSQQSDSGGGGGEGVKKKQNKN